MRYTSRKLVFFTVALLLLTYLVVYGFITPEVFGNSFWAVSAGYAGGNVGEHFAGRKS